ncbi:MAG: hypothetical protein N2C12_03780, partial [Planctomycetales bacterium]
MLKSLPKDSVAKLKAAIAERVKAEKRVTDNYESELAEVDDRFDVVNTELKMRYEKIVSKIKEEFDLLVAESEAEHEEKCSQLETEFANTRNDVEDHYQEEMAAADKRRKDEQWEATALFDTTEKKIKKELGGLSQQREQAEKSVGAALEQVNEIIQDGFTVLARRRVSRLPVDFDPPAPVVTSLSALEQLQNLQAQAIDKVDEVRGQLIGKLYSGFMPVVVLMASWLAAILPIGLIMKLSPLADSTLPDWSNLLWITYSGCAGVVLAVLFLGLLYPAARKQSSSMYVVLTRISSQAENIHRQAIASLDEQIRNRNEKVKQSFTEGLSGHNVEADKAEQIHQEKVSEATTRRDRALEAANDVFPRRIEELKEAHNKQIDQLNHGYPPRLEVFSSEYERDIQSLANERQERHQELQSQQQQQWQEMADSWKASLDELEQVALRRAERPLAVLGVQVELEEWVARCALRRLGAPSWRLELGRCQVCSVGGARRPQAVASAGAGHRCRVPAPEHAG